MRIVPRVLILAVLLAPRLSSQQSTASSNAIPASLAQPLIIIDGAPVTTECEPFSAAAAGGISVRNNGNLAGRISGLSPSDIETAQMLKGSAPLAYGAAGAHGVVTITTKKTRHYCINAGTASTFSDPIAAHFFSPSLIMAHQREVSLQNEQRNVIVSDLQQSQANYVQLQWKLSGESEQLQKLLQPATVNEGLVLAQIDRVLAIERDIKRAQVALLVRIKNTLSAEQQASLSELRKLEK